MDRSFWSWTFGLCWWAAMWWILGKYSTRLPSALRQMCPKFCIVVNFWTNSIFLLKQDLMLGSDSLFQDITQNPKIHKPLHAIDWWLLHHWPEIIVSMENLPHWFETLQKSHLIVPTINFSDMSNICVKVRSFPVCLMECKFSEKFVPKNTDASNVEYMLIPQIKECLSLSCIASFEDWSNIFRTRSFTLCNNDRDSNERSDSVMVSESISLTMTNLSSTGLSVLATNISSDFHSWEDHFSSICHSE